MAECGIAVEGNIVAYPCHLEDGHDGPHEAVENAASVRERKRWLEAQQQLAEFQGPPQTTAERYTANPSPYPEGSDKAKVSAGSGGAGDQSSVGGKAGGVVLEDRVTEADLQRPRDMRRTTSEDLASKPTKTRPGDQTLPVQRQGEESVQDRVIHKMGLLVEQGRMDPEDAERIIATMQESKEVGIQRYGTALQTFNGRDTLRDAEEEARDLFVYLSTLNQARDQDRSVAVEAAVAAIYEYHQSHEGDAMTVEDIVKITVETVYNGLGI